MKLKYAIALTGGIAVGKSSAMSFMSMYGFRCIDADKIAHDILDEQRDKIESMFGSEVLSATGVNRVELGKIVFADMEKRKSLESLLHPLIYDRIMALAQIEEERKFPYFIDIPLFFENKRYDIDKSLVVYAPKDLQIQRLMKRNNLSREEAIMRINSQLDIEQKKLQATYIIDNTKDIKHLQNECEKVRGIILEDFK
ncbi:Dephospho-CoA kinase [Sulfurovum sp. enrichment culture clone C5]|uniref:Dephospho-CoA kinase n=1 Tax=Sulfurovum sp. enrichment culture clone C5 TaxID=497650 RepID=A0A0S4XPB3_9BACT|nr:Dephospho-CoA kinase [Sulfurovum sp. enrichment culture clone C5]